MFVTCSWMVAEMIMLFLRSPTRNISVGLPFRGAMTAFREKMSVSARRLAWAVFINTQPSMMALMIRPRMFWMMRTMMASGHSSVTIRPPKPIVTWYYRHIIVFISYNPFKLSWYCSRLGHWLVSYLNLNGEEKSRCEGVNGSDTRHRPGLVGISRLQITVSERQEPPNHGKEHPRAEECWSEDEEGMLPFQVHHCGEHILEKPALRSNKVIISSVV